MIRGFIADEMSLGAPMAGFDLDGFLPYQLAVLSARISRDFATLYHQKFGISMAEWRVVAHLSQSGSVSVREIHEKVDMDKPKVSRAASRLEAQGYISKTANTDDGRLVSLALTEKGEAMIAELIPLADAYEKSVFERLGTEEPAFKRAIQLLLKVRE